MPANYLWSQLESENFARVCEQEWKCTSVTTKNKRAMEMMKTIVGLKTLSRVCEHVTRAQTIFVLFACPATTLRCNWGSYFLCYLLLHPKYICNLGPAIFYLVATPSSIRNWGAWFIYVPVASLPLTCNWGSTTFVQVALNPRHAIGGPPFFLVPIARPP